MALALRLWLALVAALLACAPAAAQTFPKFTGLVVDAANALPQPTRDDLTRKLEALQKDTGRQLVVATIPDLQGYPIEDYGYRMLRAWGVGLKDVNNGAILFVAPSEHKLRLEVGYGLEPVLTDAFAAQVIQTAMVPKLRAGDTAGAMTAGTNAVIQQLRASPDEAKARTDAAIRDFDRSHRRSASRSGGGIPVAAIFWLVILGVFVVPMLFRRRRSGPWGSRYDGGGGSSSWPIVLWGLGNALGSSHGRDDDGGGWGGGGGGWGGGGSDGSWGGGGFTGGGGGSGGGGGASGSW